MIRFKKITHDVRSLLPELAKMCHSEADIAALYLFGSHAKETTGPLSDLDIAVLLDKGVAPKRYFTKRLHLISIFSKKLGTNEVELIILNTAPLLLSYQVAKEGKLLFERDHTQRVAFETKIIDYYLDSKHYREVGRRYLNKMIMEGRYIG